MKLDLSKEWYESHIPKEDCLNCGMCESCIERSIAVIEEMEADDTNEFIEAMKEGFAVRLADVEARAEAVKNDFANRLADAEDKAEKYRLALEKCRRIIEAGSMPTLDISDIHWTLAEALK